MLLPDHSPKIVVLYNKTGGSPSLQETDEFILARWELSATALTISCAWLLGLQLYVPGGKVSGGMADSRLMQCT